MFVLGGVPVSQVDKLPSGGEIRVHEHFGGSSRPVPLRDEAAELALAANAAAGRVLGVPLDYGRVDMMRLPDGTLAVSELEVTEPGLYLDVLPGERGSVRGPGCRSAGLTGLDCPAGTVCTRPPRVLNMRLALLA